MKRITIFLVLAVLYFQSTNSQQMSKKYSYLALGDSYTIGESVPSEQNFPHQVVSMLRKKELLFDEPRIIAKTGWTTDELQDAIEKAKPGKDYDFVSLLIGVNNQYRGRSSGEYAEEFESLLKQAIAFAKGNAGHVFVLSIPDWGITPFAEGRDRKKIAEEIDAFNAINRTISAKYNVHYIDITPGTREAATNRSLLAEDGLHPSGKEYERWATVLASSIESVHK